MQKPWLFLKTLAVRFFSDQCPMRAASLTLTTLLSIVPLMIFTFYLLSFFPLLNHSGVQIEQFIVTHFVASSAAVISQYMQDFLLHAHILSWMNVLALIFIAALLIFNIIDTVNGVWHIKTHRHWAISFFLYLVLIFIAPLILALLLLAGSTISSLFLLSHLVEVDVVQKPFMSVTPFLIEWVAFSLFHWIMPSCRVYFRYALMAGLITTLLFEMAKWGFAEYLHYFSTYQLVYGALATIPIFFIWMYMSWLIVILGALICNMLQSRQLYKGELL
ncbi:MAG: YihY family inner membrane protein [Gammaproteobacteria bacterium]|nr:YihY family inner membrane protein [Gammaproteobacteria bacterium]